jgi:hypothetical protein
MNFYDENLKALQYVMIKKLTRVNNIMAYSLKPIDPGNILAYMAVTENEREDS